MVTHPGTITNRAGLTSFMRSTPLTKDRTGSHDPGIQRPVDPVDPVTLFYNELQMSIECVNIEQ